MKVQRRIVDVFRLCLLSRGLHLFQAIKIKIGEGEVRISFVAEEHGVAQVCERFVVLSEITIDVTQVVPRYPKISRVSSRPEFVSLPRLFQVAGYKMMVVRLDVKLLALAHPFAQLVRLPAVLHPERSLPQGIIAVTESGVGHGETRVKANGPLEKGNSGGIVVHR